MAHLAMRNGADGEASANTLTVDRLLSAPLPTLLAEVGAEIVDAPTEYDDFEGVALKPRVGPIQVVLPTARSARHREAVARLIVGQLLGADITPPKSLDVRTYGGTR
jgi:hypothetical protein